MFLNKENFTGNNIRKQIELGQKHGLMQDEGVDEASDVLKKPLISSDTLSAIALESFTVNDPVAFKRIVRSEIEKTIKYTIPDSITGGEITEEQFKEARPNDFSKEALARMNRPIEIVDGKVLSGAMELNLRTLYLNGESNFYSFSEGNRTAQLENDQSYLVLKYGVDREIFDQEKSKLIAKYGVGGRSDPESFNEELGKVADNYLQKEITKLNNSISVLTNELSDPEARRSVDESMAMIESKTKELEKFQEMQKDLNGFKEQSRKLVETFKSGYETLVKNEMANYDFTENHTHPHEFYIGTEQPAPYSRERDTYVRIQVGDTNALSEAIMERATTTAVLSPNRERVPVVSFSKDYLNEALGDLGNGQQATAYRMGMVSIPNSVTVYSHDYMEEKLVKQLEQGTARDIEFIENTFAREQIRKIEPKREEIVASENKSNLNPETTYITDKVMAEKLTAITGSSVSIQDIDNMGAFGDRTFPVAEIITDIPASNYEGNDARTALKESVAISLGINISEVGITTLDQGDKKGEVLVINVKNAAGIEVDSEAAQIGMIRDFVELNGGIEELAKNGDKVKEFQRMMNKLAELNPNIGIDLGTTGDGKGIDGDLEGLTEESYNKTQSYYKDINIVTRKGGVVDPELKAAAMAAAMVDGDRQMTDGELNSYITGVKATNKENAATLTPQ